jgi:hypothetical protein
MASVVSKSIGWCAFSAGLIGAGIGIAWLQVIPAVLCLIVASVSGLILLKMRAEAQGRLEPVEESVPNIAGELAGTATT